MRNTLFNRLCPESGFARSCSAVGLTVFIGLFALGAASTLRMRDLFRSSAQLRLETVWDRNGDTNSAHSFDTTPGPFLIWTEREVLKSDTVLSRAIKALDAGGGWNEEPGFNSSTVPPGERIIRLRRRVEVKPVSSEAIEVSASSEDPIEAANVVNAIAEAYSEHLLESFDTEASFAGLRVSLEKRAEPATSPMPGKNVAKLARSALGAFLLGVAAVTMAGWILVRARKLRNSFRVFGPLFAIVLCLVIGSAVLFSGAAFSSAAVLGLWGAFVIASFVQWCCIFANRYPGASGVFPAVTALVFVVLVTASALELLSAPKLSMGTALVRLGPNTTNAPDLNFEAQSMTIYDRGILESECAFIRSREVLSNVVEDLNLHEVLGKRSPKGRPLPTSEAVRFLTIRTRVSPAPYPSMIQIQAADENPDLCNAIVRSLAGHYRQLRNSGNSSPGNFAGQIWVTILEPGFAPEAHITALTRRRLVSQAHLTVLLTSAAGAGAALGAWLTTRAARRFRVVLELALAIGMLVPLALLFNWKPDTYTSTARVRLVGNNQPSPHPGYQLTSRKPSKLDDLRHDCHLLNSKGFQRNVIENMPARLKPLDSRVVASPFPKRHLIEIRATSENSAEAADFANAVAETYRDQRHTDRWTKTRTSDDLRAEIVNRAVPSSECDPRHFNAALGALGGPFAAFLAGLALSWVGITLSRRRADHARPQR